MSKPTIHGVTVSVDLSDKEYGNGQGSFMNIQAKYPEPGQPLDDLLDVVTDGLDMYFAAWKTLLAGRFATGYMTSTEFKDTLSKVTARVDKTRKFLKTDGTNNDGQ